MRSFRFLPLAVLGCNSPKDPTDDDDISSDADSSPDDTGPVDADGDGYVAGEDCDDSNANLYDLVTGYGDHDGDGYVADVTQPTYPLCGSEYDIEEGYDLIPGDDCNDALDSVHPGAAEVCYNGIDDNCDLSPTPCEFSGNYILESDADAFLVGKRANDYAAESMSSGGDLTGDGADDLLVNAYHNDDGAPEGGITYLQTGSISSGTAFLSNSPIFFVGSQANALFGFRSENVGDVTADGFDDLVVTAPYSQTGGIIAGAVYLFEGPFIPGTYFSSSALTSRSGSTYQALGWSLSSAGDVNGDGLNDFVIGLPGYGASGSDAWGAVDLIHGGDGLIPSVTLIGATSVDQAGSAVSGGGDVDGDGTPDLLIGAPLNPGFGGPKTVAWSSIPLEGGAAYFVSGGSPPSSGTFDLSGADTIFNGATAGESSGAAVSLKCDLNNDGYTDVLIGAPAKDYGALELAGAVYLFFGPVDPGDLSNDSADAIYLGMSNGDVAGGAFDCTDNFNGTGSSALLIGANQSYADYYSGATNGVTYLVINPVSGTQTLSDAAQASFSGIADGDWGGLSVAFLDHNSDILADLAVGLPGYLGRTGAAALFNGKSE